MCLCVAASISAGCTPLSLPEWKDREHVVPTQTQQCLPFLLWRLLKLKAVKVNPFHAAAPEEPSIKMNPHRHKVLNMHTHVNGDRV